MNFRSLIVGAGLIVLALALFRVASTGDAPGVPAPPIVSAIGTVNTAAARPDRDRSTIPSVPVTVAPLAAPAPTNDWRQLLLTGGEEATHLPRETIERWIAADHTNAEDFLAARQVGGGLDYLRRALTNYPNDPRVLFASVALDDGPEAARDRADRFKAAAPDNALADYLSARDHLKNGRPDEAMKDLVAAGSKTGFHDYSLDAMQNAEEMYLAAGKSPVEAKALGTSTALLPHLAQLKGLTQDLAALEERYQAAGDKESVERLAAMGVQLGQQLVSGEGSRTLIGQLVGAAIERIALKPLETGRDYEFLSGTVQDRIDQLNARKAAIREEANTIDGFMRRASEAELISYFDRFKIYGESGAMAWLRQRMSGP